jgi:small-conductance mechanosensitive channel
MSLISFLVQDQPVPTPPTGEPSAFERLFSVNELRGEALSIWQWIDTNLINVAVLIQLGCVLAVFVAASFFAPWLRKRIDKHLTPRAPVGFPRRAVHALAVIAGPIAAWMILNLVSFGFVVADRSHAWIGAAISLTLAWIVIRLVTLVIRSKFWSQVAFYTVWPLAALDVFGVLNDLIDYLNAASIPLGVDASGAPRDLSALDVVRAVLAFAILFWIANVLSSFLSKRIHEIEDLTPSLRALITKVLNILLPVLAFFFALQFVGVNLAALAVFSGAVGLGVGLGLQSTVSNLISGFTLIADKSIKPGDVVTVEDTFGWVTNMGARSVAIRTRDGTEHLVPNDKFIQNGVINWSHDDTVVRLHAPFGVSYGTKDLRKVRKLAYEALEGLDRVVKVPTPQCNMVEYGDSSINFDLRFWIKDPEKGIANIRSEVFLNLHDKLLEAGIEIPFPQRDLHFRSITPEVAAVLKGPRED